MPPINRERTKMEKNKIILGVILFGFLIIILFFVIIFSLIPRIKEVEKIKLETVELKKNLETYKKEGIPLNVLQETLKGGNVSLDKNVDSNYISSVLKDINSDFYSKNLKNNSGGEYNKFINDKIEKYKNDSSSEEKLKIISKILPYYSDSVREDDYLTDFEFINYIESIVSTFNISYSNPIGITDIKQIEGYSLTNSDNQLDKGIYKIPIELSVIGRKSSIIDFLYYIENVGKISFNEETGKISVKVEESEDGEIFSDFKNKKLDGDRRFSESGEEDKDDYNIFDNQIVDIESIYMDKYIDSSEKETDTTEEKNSFLKYIKSTQNNERFEAKINLNFYVKGVPKYKIEEFLIDFNKKLAELDSKIQSSLGNNNLSSTQRQKLSNLSLNIKTIKSSINGASKDLPLVDRYQNITGYSELLDKYEEDINSLNL